MDERKYIAISVKHSNTIYDLTLWGYQRTEDGEKRCFAGYVNNDRIDTCELYSLKDFQEKYGNGVIKCDEPIHITTKVLKKFKNYDTVLADIEEYKQFLSFIGYKKKFD